MMSACGRITMCSTSLLKVIQVSQFIGANFDHSAFLDNFKLGEILGEGGFGTVYKAVHKETGDIVAVKYMDITEMLQHADQIEEIYREAEALQKLNHKGIIHLYKAFVLKKTVIMVIEFCGGGELYERMQEVKTFKELDSREVFLQIASAMSYCHN